MPNFEEDAKRAQQLPASLQFAIVTLLKNIPNGAFWGFTSYAEAKKYAEALKQDSNITARKLGTGDAVLIEINPDYLLKAVSAVDASLLTQADVQNMQKGIATAGAQMEKFLISKADKAYTGLVGIYCTNDTPTITYKGVSYPAFRINIMTALNALANWGYQVKVGDKFVPPQAAAQSGAALFASMQLSPTSTGVFMQVRSTLTPEQLKNIKAQRGVGKKSTK